MINFNSSNKNVSWEALATWQAPSILTSERSYPSFQSKSYQIEATNCIFYVSIRVNKDKDMYILTTKVLGEVEKVEICCKYLECIDEKCLNEVCDIAYGKLLAKIYLEYGQKLISELEPLLIDDGSFTLTDWELTLLDNFQSNLKDLPEDKPLTLEGEDSEYIRLLEARMNDWADDI